MTRYNLHQHSSFSDGAVEPEAYVQKAVALNFTAVGFTEHSPLPFPTPFSLKQERVTDYVAVTERLKKKYEGQVDVYRALEMDFIPGFSEDFASWRHNMQLDYAIGSVHLVKTENSDDLWFIDGPKQEIYDKGLNHFFGGDIKKAVRAYYHQMNRMIETQKFEIVGHVDKIKMHNQNRYFTEEEAWYRDLLLETLSLIKEKDLIVELNTRGMYKKRSDALFPDGFGLQYISEHDIQVVITSDAHHPDELNLLFDYAAQHLKEFNIKSVQNFDGKNWLSVPLV